MHLLKNIDYPIAPQARDANEHTASISPSRAFARKASVRSLLVAASVLLFVAGCSKPVEKIEDVRPVRVMKLQTGSVESEYEFAGDVRPRVESRLGFRVPGKIAARKVDVGSLVKRGQLLMQLDPQDLQLAQAQAQAGARAAQSNLELASAEYKRYQELRQTNFVSQAILDAKETSFRAAKSNYEQAQAALKLQGNQAAYTGLVADVDGVVTAIDAEVGQVVAAGTPVVKIAQTAEKEVVIGLPENKLEMLRNSKDVQIRLWADKNIMVVGKIRELAPMADPATRTYAAKVSMINPPPQVRLGMTAYVSFANHLANQMIKVPLSALYQEKGITSVWVVENNQVKLVPVVVAGPSGNEMLLSSGVKSGQMVVTAGVNLLKPGQKVKILASLPEADVAKLPAKTAATEAAPSAAPGAAQLANGDGK